MKQTTTLGKTILHTLAAAALAALFALSSPGSAHGQTITGLLNGSGACPAGMSCAPPT